MKRYGLLGVLLCLLTAFAACTPADFPSRNGMLRFSVDTHHFDTLFSTVGSTTAWLKVYNPNSKKIQIDRVCLKSEGKNSPFRFSLDGLSGSDISSYTIRGGDSAFVFVEMTAEWQHNSEPVLWEDAIAFDIGEVRQEIALQAYSWDAIVWKGKRFSADTVLRAEWPYLIYDSLVIEEGVTLDIEEGVTFYFHDKAVLLSYGTVKAQGSLDKPVVFRGDRLDDAFEDFPYDNYPGQWYAVYLGEESYGNVFDHVRIRGAYYGIIADSSSMDSTKLSLTNSIIFNMVYSNLYAISSKMTVANTLLANSGSYTVVLLGGEADFVHCTIANYQSLVARGEEPSVALVNYSVDANKKVLLYPLRKADFTNTIIYGSHTTEVGFGLMEDTDHQFYFRNCLLRSESKIPEGNAAWMQYNIEPKFLNNGRGYQYDFRIDSSSVAIAAADTSYSKLYPLDINGYDRMQDGQSDVGAYEFCKIIDF